MPRKIRLSTLKEIIKPKWGGRARRVQSATAQNKGQHGARQCTEHHYADQAKADGESDYQIVRPIGTAQDVPKKNSRDAQGAEDGSQRQTCHQFAPDYLLPIPQPNFAKRHRWQDVDNWHALDVECGNDLQRTQKRIDLRGNFELQSADPIRNRPSIAGADMKSN